MYFGQISGLLKFSFPFNAFVAKLIHAYLKAIAKNPIQVQNQFCMLIKVHNSLLSRTSV